MLYVGQVNPSARAGTTPFATDVTVTAPLPVETEPDRSVSAEELSNHYAGGVKTSQAEFDWIGNTNPFQRLRHLVTLEDNWDGYGAPEFSWEQVSRALELYASIYSYYLEKKMSFSQLAPFIAPGSDGSILFEWAGQRFPSRELELFVPAAPADELEYLKSSNNGDEEGTSPLEEIVTLLGWLFITETK